MLPVSSAQNAEVETRREFSEGSEVPVSNHAGPVKTLTVRPLPGEDIIDVIHRLAETVQGATILNQQIFGKLEASTAVTGAMRRTFGKMDWPATWMDGGPCDGNWIAGIQVSVLNHGTVQRIEVDGSVCGSIFEDDAGRHCLVGGLVPALTFPSRSYQTKEVLEKLQSVLSTGGFSLAETIRTWFYLDDILAWYNEFNVARTEIYSGVKFKTGSLPVSTGIGARNPAGAALTLAAWAMQPANGARVREIASPLQCPAPAYGSSFSRAMEIPAALTGNC